MNDPYKPGEFSDLNIYTQRLKNSLSLEEVIIPDRAYRDLNCLSTDCVPFEYIKHCRARRETAFKRLKSFNVLNNVYRHSIDKHVDCLYAVANLVQLSARNGSLLPEL